VDLELQGGEITAGEIEAAGKRVELLRTAEVDAHNKSVKACGNYLSLREKRGAGADEIKTAEEEMVSLGIEGEKARIQRRESDNRLGGLWRRETTGSIWNMSTSDLMARMEEALAELPPLPPESEDARLAPPGEILSPERSQRRAEEELEMASLEARVKCLASNLGAKYSDVVKTRAWILEATNDFAMAKTQEDEVAAQGEMESLEATLEECEREIDPAAIGKTSFSRWTEAFDGLVRIKTGQTPEAIEVAEEQIRRTTDCMDSSRTRLQELREEYANLMELAERGEATEEAIASMIANPYSGAELFMKYHGLAREIYYLQRQVQ
jgi:hypothetical protein